MTSSKKYKSKVQLNHLKDGDISYYVVYKNNGQTVRKKVGKKSEGITETKAIALRNSILSNIRLGIDISTKSAKTLRVDDIAKYYIDNNIAHIKSIKKYEQIYIKHIKPYIGQKSVYELNDSIVYQMQTRLINQNKSKSTINQIIKLIRTILNNAIKIGLIEYSPLKNIKMFAIDNQRLRYLSISEIEKLKEIIKNDKELYLFVSLALSTGARANSILNICLKDIDFDNKIVRIKDFKRDNFYSGYFDSETYELIKSYKNKKANTKLIKSNYQSIYKKLFNYFKIFNKHLAKSDRQNRVVVHTLRHTFASHLAIKGVSVQEIQKLMNHSDIKMTMRYAHLNPNSGKEYIENLYKGENKNGCK